MATAISPRKRLAFVTAAIAGSIALTFIVLLAADIHLHHKYGDIAGFNIHGYRGPVADRKLPGERRIVVLGGSSAMGYGVPPRDAMPAQLEEQLNARADRPAGRTYRVVNLAWNSEGAYSFQHTLRDYERLDYDAAVLYEGYNDLMGSERNRRVFRHESGVFRLTGYLPILPMILREKAMAVRSGGNLEAAYRDQRTVFRPNLAARATASTLEAAAGISRSLERQLGGYTNAEPGAVWAAGGAGSAECAAPWAFYCQSVAAAVDQALSRGVAVVVGTQPYISDVHVEQQAALRGMLAARFSAHPRFRYVDLGRAVDLRDASLAYDGMHLTLAGNRRIAEGFAAPVREALETGEEP